MAFFIERRKRLTIPRWRDFQRGPANSEIIILAPNQTKGDFETDSLVRKVEDWNARPSKSTAIELVNSAFALGAADYALDAAKYLLKFEKELPKSLLKIVQLLLRTSVKSNESNSGHESFEQFIGASRKEIAEIRALTRANPNNPLLWTKLARNHSILGNNESAKRALDIALGLTKYSNSYVQRVAARFYYHIHEIERAIHLLRKSPHFDVDPWLVSTDIAYTTRLSRRSKSIGLGTKMLESNRFNAKDITELASVIGTYQLTNGMRKEAKRSFNIALMEPNENSLAQVEWVSEVFTDLKFETFLSIPQAFEARAHEFYTKKDYRGAFGESMKWLLDQPISNRAAVFSQYIALAHLEDFKRAISIGDFALRSNPDSFEIINNLAYSYARLGQTGFARFHLNKMKTLSTNDRHKIVMLATEGLISIREGNTGFGKSLYLKSIELARKIKDDYLLAQALVNYLREAELVNNDFELLTLLYDVITRVDDEFVQRELQGIERRLK